MKEILTKKECNLGRQLELDVAKALAIIFMVWVHVNEVYQSPLIEGGLYSRVIEFVGSPPAAPIFMMTLGIGVVYSRRSSAKILLKRGIGLIALGYILNIIRDFIPYYLLFRIENDVSYIYEGWDLTWGIDILPFAGLVFIFFAFVKKFKLKNMAIFMLLCTFMILNLLLEGRSFENPIINGLFRLIWGTDENSWFPFLTWITFPVVGYFFGQILKRCSNKDLFYKKLLLVTGSLSIPLWIYSYVRDVRFGAFGELYQTEYYHHDLMGNLVLCIFALFWISLCYFSTKIIPVLVEKVMIRWSKNTNLMYCVHWTILGFGRLIIEIESCMPLQLFLINVVVFILTDFICIQIDKLKKIKVNRDHINGITLGYN